MHRIVCAASVALSVYRYTSEVGGCLSLRAQPGNRFVSFVHGPTRREIIIRWVVLSHGRFFLLLRLLLLLLRACALGFCLFFGFWLLASFFFFLFFSFFSPARLCSRVWLGLVVPAPVRLCAWLLAFGLRDAYAPARSCAWLLASVFLLLLLRARVLGFWLLSWLSAFARLAFSSLHV